MKTSELIESMVRQGYSFYSDTNMGVTRYGWVSFRAVSGDWIAAVDTTQMFADSINLQCALLNDADCLKIINEINRYISTPVIEREGDTVHTLSEAWNAVSERTGIQQVCGHNPESTISVWPSL